MMPRKLKYEQFESKGHHNKENPEHNQNDRKPQIWSVSLSQNYTKMKKVNKL